MIAEGVLVGDWVRRDTDVCEEIYKFHDGDNDGAGTRTHNVV